MKNTLGIIINNPCKGLAALTEHRNPLTLPFFARYRLVDFALSNMVNSDITKIGIIASDKYRSLLDHVGTGQEWGLSRKSQSLFILQGARKIGNVNSRDINLMDFAKNGIVFDRNRARNILISTPNIVCRIDYNDLYDDHKKWNADITLVGTKVENDDVDLGSDCIYMHVEEDGRVTEMTIGRRPNSTHHYSAKLIVKRETILELMETAPDLGEYEMLTLIMELFDQFDVRCHTFDGYLRRINTIKDYFDTSLELIDTQMSCELFYGDKIIYTKIKDNHPTLYKDTSCVKCSCVASGSIIHGEIENSVLFRQIVQGKNSKIKNSILMEGCRIGENTELEYVIADRNVTIGDNVVLKGTPDSPVVLKKETVI